MIVIEYLMSNIFKQPPLFIGLIALIGLLLQKKNTGEIIKGTFKTVIGVIILFIGVNLISSAVGPLSAAFSTLYKLPAANQFNPEGWTNILGNYGTQIGTVLALSFAINVIVAKFTPIKNIFLTGHILFWMAFISVAAGVEGGLSGIGLIAFATFFLSLYIIVVPAIVRPFVKTVTGSDDFTIGHTAAIFCVLGGLIGKFVGDKEKSTENMKIPKSLDFFRDTTISTAVIMFLTYIFVGLIIGGEARLSVFGEAVGTINTIGGMQYDFFSFSLLASLTFSAGITILLTGVRLMIGELIPAFKGVSDKLIPDAIPALDIPMIFPFAPNALLIGFLLSMVSSIGTILILASMGLLKFAVIPLVTACFFDVAPGAIFANATGGRTAAIITSIVGGVLMVLLISGSISVLFNSAAGFNQLFGGNDFSIWSILAGFTSKLLGAF